MALIDTSFEVGTKKTEIVDDFCAYHGRPLTIKDAQGQDITNPETKPAFMKRKIADFIKESVKAYRVNKKGDEARQTEISSVDSTISIS
jgi:hypothetical protein